MVQHRELTGDDLHEPKGVESATEGTVYVSDGAGSGRWKTLGSSKVLLETTLESDEGNIIIPAGTSIEDAILQLMNEIDKVV